MHRRRATVATSGEWQRKTGGVRRRAVANGPNIFQMLRVLLVWPGTGAFHGIFPMHTYCVTPETVTCSDGAMLRHECLAEMHEVRKSLLADYSVNPLLVRDCSHEIDQHCGGRVQRSGRTVHCLMNLARSAKTEDDATISPKCVRTVSSIVV